jgi:hypothetical protein
MKTSFARVLLLSAAVAGMAGDVHAQQSDAAVILQFERAADTYAFTHRQDDRRGTAPARLVEGEFFTPIAAASFRARIRSVAGCNARAHGEGGYEVPAVNASAASTDPLPQCIAVVLPPLPEELEYRVAGVALLLADAHRNVVVDVLHAAFP